MEDRETQEYDDRTQESFPVFAASLQLSGETEKLRLDYPAECTQLRQETEPALKV